MCLLFIIMINTVDLYSILFRHTLFLLKHMMFMYLIITLHVVVLVQLFPVSIILNYLFIDLKYIHKLKV